RFLEVLVVLRHWHDADVHVLPVDETLGDEQQLVVADNVLRAPDELERVVQRLSVEAPDLLPCEQVVLVRPYVPNGTLRQAPILGRRESEAQRVYDLPRETLLDFEDVLQRAVELVGPELHVGAGVDELRRDPKAGTSAPNAPGQRVTRAKLPRDSTQVL